jgi:RNA polymerase sigma-70 factor (ECF subfamily)
MNAHMAAGELAVDPQQNWPQSIREFEALVEALQDRLVHFAFCRLGNIQDAEDVVQEVFVRAYAHREKLKNISWVAPYLFRMAGNRCTDMSRKLKHAAAPLDESGAAEVPDSQNNAFEIVSALKEQRRIEDLLGCLPGREAEVIRLRVFAELSFAEIAVAVGSSVPTVKSRFRYGLEKLRKVVTREGVTK